MEIKEILDEKTWEKFVLSQTPHTPFLQSWAWGEFQEAMGLSHRRVGLFDKGKMVGGVQALVGSRKLGRFVYVPRGPLIKSATAVGGVPSEGGRVSSQKPVVGMLEHLKKLAGREKADYLRIEPPWEADAGGGELLKKLAFKPALATSQAGGTTLLLDLRRSEEELLMGMRKTTRYLVRKGQEMGIEVQRTRDPEQMDEFHRLMAVTYRRQGFVPHSQRYLQTQFETLAPRGMMELYFARYHGDISAMALIVTYGDTASYAHGASARSEIPASYVLLWEAIRQAKKSDLDFYDFWGIAPTDDPRHPWYGYSLFKKGFGGYRVDYLGTWDFPLTPRYLAVAGAEQVRKFLRRY